MNSLTAFAERRTRLLVVDDEASVRDALGDYLSANGYEVHGAADAAEMDVLLPRTRPHLIVLDWLMPGERGIDACRRLRYGGTPIIMLSAYGNDEHRIEGLESGADDYLAKPFHPRELLARIRTVLKRNGLGRPTSQRYAFGGWTLVPEDRSLIDESGASILLSPGETAMLKAFADNPRQIMSRDLLAALVLGPDVEAYDRAIDLQVSRLRRKLGDLDAGLIQTVRRLGYRFMADVRPV